LIERNLIEENLSKYWVLSPAALATILFDHLLFVSLRSAEDVVGQAWRPSGRLPVWADGSVGLPA